MCLVSTQHLQPAPHCGVPMVYSVIEAADSLSGLNECCSCPGVFNVKLSYSQTSEKTVIKEIQGPASMGLGG